MSRKSNLKRFKTIVNGNMAGSLISTVTNIEFLDNIGVQLNFSGSPVGNFQVQVSIDYDQDINGNVINAGSWVPVQLSNSSTNAPSSLGSPIYIDLNQLSAPWIRIAYNFTSGTGILSAFICAKMV